jgi:putative flippase GtrA
VNRNRSKPLWKSVLFGLATAVVAAVVWLFVTFVLPVAVPFLVSRFSNDGGGGATAYVTSDSILLAALVGFASGFFWRYRRLAQQP